jgi:hypothetical protein
MKLRLGIALKYFCGRIETIKYVWMIFSEGAGTLDCDRIILSKPLKHDIKQRLYYFQYDDAIIYFFDKERKIIAKNNYHWIQAPQLVRIRNRRHKRRIAIDFLNAVNRFI